jgi:hypothetical protein
MGTLYLIGYAFGPVAVGGLHLFIIVLTGEPHTPNDGPNRFFQLICTMNYSLQSDIIEPQFCDYIFGGIGSSIPHYEDVITNSGVPVDFLSYLVHNAPPLASDSPRA